MPDADLIRRVTANYFFWQGLRWIPGGLWMLAVAASQAGRLPLSEEAAALAGGLLALLAYRRIDTWYQHHFGQVRTLPGMHRRREQLKWLLVYPAILAALVLDGTVRPPVFLSGLVFAAALLAYWWSTGRGRRHYLAAAAASAALTLLPPLGIMPLGDDLLTLTLALWGGIFVLAGILDHRQLRRLFPPPSNQPADGLAV